MSKFKKPPIYKNKYYLEKEKYYQEFLYSDNNPPTLSQNISLKDIKHIYFELSNMCVYSHLHPRCPVSVQKTKKVLSSKIVKKVVDELGKIDYKGFISFHRYNEPLIDPRLFEFIEYIKVKCPGAMIRVLTNGFYLDQTIIDELYEKDIEYLTVSAYFPEEYKRLIKLKAKFPYTVFFSILDSRMNMYYGKILNLKKPCYALLNDITINCNGDLTICCLDWKNKHIFGNLEKTSLSKIISSKKYLKVYSNLANGKRNLQLCQRCDWQR